MAIIAPTTRALGHGDTVTAEKARHDHNAHGHRGHAHHHGQQAGKQLGQQLQQQGNYDLAQRLLINETARRALENSAKIDKMLQSNAINQEGWSQLKNTMTESMTTAIEQQTQDMPVLAPIDTRSTVLDGAAPTTEVNINVAGPTIAPPSEPEMELEKGDAPGAAEGALAALEEDTTPSGSSKDVVDLRAAAPLIFAMDGSRGIDLTSDTVPGKSAAPTTEIQIKGAAGGEFTNFDGVQGRSELNEKKNLLLAQQLLQGAPVKAKPATAETPKKRKSVAGRTLAKVAHLFGLDDKAIPKAITATGFRKSGDDANALPLPEITAEAESDEEAIEFEWDELLLLALIGLLAAGFAGSIYLLRRRGKTPMQVLVPGSGEHFTIRAGENEGDFVLDVKDVRGQFIRSAGMLRPESVARAAVLPPTLAAKLGAQSAFDRFEFTADRSFARTDKEEGYQVFPFVIENRKKAS